MKLTKTQHFLIQYPPFNNMRILILLSSFLLISGNIQNKSVNLSIVGAAPIITLEKNGKIQPHFRPPFRIKKGTRLA
jgi:hypothetical protein